MGGVVPYHRIMGHTALALGISPGKVACHAAIRPTCLDLIDALLGVCKKRNAPQHRPPQPTWQDYF